MIRPLHRYTSIVFAAAILNFAAAQPLPAPPAGMPPNSPAAPSNAPTPVAPGAPLARTPQKPKNLKVLPQNTDIRAVMHQYESDLGVRCSFCHAAADETTHRTDYASDANPAKDTARFMIQMTADLNNKYLAEMPMRMFADPITCGTCHRGQSHPSVFMGQAPADANRPAGTQPAGSPPAPAMPATGSSR